ncbi:AraC family transcriptional regulator [Microbacterium sp. Root166]|uniref:AraC family transcriptional regulator n=1 Tax=Microbacterium sp. Root166 TaxID=1736478 RepID=UPI0007012A41|nr:AraC family transcriptional regulator [Microbacterium sp. Root166]KQZ85495.1 AraC family transcriptional regulator [Microbacterium sp. Root166]
MDETTTEPTPHYRVEGFADQRLCVVPQPQVDAALARPGTRRLTVTDAGYFPAAAGHRRVRGKGAPETIVLLCVAGRGTATIAGDTFTLTPSACIVIPAGAPHVYETSYADPWSIWWMHVRGSDVAELTGPLLGQQVPLTHLRALDRVVALFDELVSSLDRRLSPAQLLTASGIAWHLLTRIAADSVLPSEGSPLERAMRHLEARMDSSIRVGELAAIVGLSPSHLSALFHQATGSGPGAFQTSLRMSRARELLDTTSLSIREVAGAVGYTDSLYFSRHFRRLHGVNPSTYRSQHKG